MNERNNYIDWLKGFAIFTVVLGHCWMRSYSQYWLIYRFHMVLFMVISGYLFNGKRCFRDFLTKKVQGLLLPYAAFSAFSVFLTVVFLDGKYNFAKYLLGMVLGGKFCGWYYNFTLWYLPLIFIVSVIMYFVVNKSGRWYFLIMGAAFLLSVPVNYIARLFFDKNYIPFSFHVIPSALVCMMFGYWLKGKSYDGTLLKNRYLNAFLAVALGLLGFALNLGRRDTIYNVESYLYLPAALMICHMIVNLTRKCYNKIVCFIGRNSLYILGTHRCIMHVIEKRTGLEDFLVSYNITGFAASMLISVPVIAGISAVIIGFRYLKIHIKKNTRKNTKNLKKGIDKSCI